MERERETDGLTNKEEEIGKKKRRIILNEEVVCYNKSPILHQKYVNIINVVPQRTKRNP